IRLANVALDYQRANTCAADARLLGLLQLDGLYYYSMFFSILLEEGNVSHALMPQAEIGSNDHSSNNKTLTQAFQEVIAAQVRDCLCEIDTEPAAKYTL